MTLKTAGKYRQESFYDQTPSKLLHANKPSKSRIIQCTQIQTAGSKAGSSGVKSGHSLQEMKESTMANTFQNK